MPLGIFGLRNLVPSDLTVLLTAGAVFAAFYFVSLYLQQVLGYGPLSVGAAFLPFSAGTATGAVVARKLVSRVGVRLVTLVGLGLATGGMLYLTQLSVDGHYVSDVLPGLLPLGFGLGLTFVPITLAGTSEASDDDAGLVSGLLNTSQQVGGSIALAVLATLAASRTTSLSHGPVTHDSLAAAQVSGFRVAFAGASLLLAGSWTIVALRLRGRHAGDPHPVDLPQGTVAGAVGCAQCAPVATSLRAYDAGGKG